MNLSISWNIENIMTPRSGTLELSVNQLPAIVRESRACGLGLAYVTRDPVLSWVPASAEEILSTRRLDRSSCDIVQRRMCNGWLTTLVLHEARDPWALILPDLKLSMPESPQWRVLVMQAYTRSLRMDGLL